MELNYIFWIWFAFFVVLALGICCFFILESFKLRKELTRTVEAAQIEHLALEEKIEIAREEGAAQARSEMVQPVRDQLAKIKTAFDQDNTHLLSQALVGYGAKKLQTCVKDTLDKHFNRMTQEFLGTIGDETDESIKELKASLCEKIWDRFQSFKQKSTEKQNVLPEGTRFAYTKGHRSIIVIEQKPQIRTVSFSEDLVHGNDAQQAIDQTSEGYRFALAFPYIYFVMVFDRERFSFQEVYFRNRPLRSISDTFCLAPLPNTYYTGNGMVAHNGICMGDDEFNKEIRRHTTISAKCETVISNFWQRTFSGDLGEGDYKLVDSRIKNLSTWQENSKKDSLFVLGITWKNAKSISAVLDTIFDERPCNHRLDPLDAEVRSCLESGVGLITKKITDGINKARAKAKNTQNFKPNEAAKVVLEDVLLGHAAKVFEHCQKSAFIA